MAGKMSRNVASGIDGAPALEYYNVMKEEFIYSRLGEERTRYLPSEESARVLRALAAVSVELLRSAGENGKSSLGQDELARLVARASGASVRDSRIGIAVSLDQGLVIRTSGCDLALAEVDSPSTDG